MVSEDERIRAETRPQAVKDGEDSRVFIDRCTQRKRSPEEASAGRAMVAFAEQVETLADLANDFRWNCAHRELG